MSGETAVKDSAPPAASAATPAAAPASTPVTARSAVEGAFDRAGKDASPASGDGKPPAGVVTPPVPPAGTPPPPGDTGLANLRTAYENLKRNTEWARSLNPDQVRIILARWDAMQRDPLSFYRQLGAELNTVPDYAAQLAPPKDDPEPGPDVYTMVNGEKVEMYSAKRQKEWREWNDRQSDRRQEERINPLMEWVNKAKAQAEEGEIRTEARKTVSQVLTDLREVPYFKENEERVSQVLAQMNPGIKAQIGVIASLYLAWSYVQRHHVFPTITSEAEKKVREDMERKAAAAAGSARPNGGGQSAGSGARPSNPAQLAAKMATGAYSKS